MTDKEILERVMKKAKKNGYNRKEPYYIYPEGQAGILIGNPTPPLCAEVTFVTEIIFSHEFAKAFWGEEINSKQYNDIWDNELNAYEHNKLRKWEFHLQQMVLEKNPLRYLEKFL